jgi:hypothetical protein
MATDLRKLIAEYRASEETDLRHKQAHRKDESESSGFRVRRARRREILRELLAWIRNAKDILKDGRD